MRRDETSVVNAPDLIILVLFLKDCYAGVCLVQKQAVRRLANVNDSVADSVSLV